MALTNHQNQKLQEIINAIKQGHKRIVLKGSAGTGKTFLSNSLIDEYRNTVKKWGIIYVTAPTHKALSVLRDKIDTKGKSFIEFQTIHSALQLQRKIDRVTGKQSFIKKKFNPKYPPFKGASLIIIDESSMLSTEFVGNDDLDETKRIIGYLNESNLSQVPIIFIGDSKQLNPVGEEDSPVFLKKDYFTVEIKEIIRQGAGNPIISLSYNLDKIWSKINEHSNKVRINKVCLEPEKLAELKHEQEVYEIILRDDSTEEWYQVSRAWQEKNQCFDYELTLKTCQDRLIDVLIDIDALHWEEREEEYIEGYLFTNDKQRIIDRLAETNGTNAVKYLAWTNAEVDAINTAVRQKIYGNPRKVELGETLVFDAPYGEYHTNQEVKVNTLVEQQFSFIVPNENSKFTHADGGLSIITQPLVDNKDGNYIKQEDGSYIYPYNQVSLPIFMVNGHIRVLHDNAIEEYKKQRKNVENLCKMGLISWEAIYFFDEQIADVKYNHALSIHKAQGSTYGKAIVNIGNANMNKNQAEKKRLFYTAITRASELVILYNVK